MHKKCIVTSNVRENSSVYHIKKLYFIVNKNIFIIKFTVPKILNVKECFCLSHEYVCFSFIHVHLIFEVLKYLSLNILKFWKTQKNLSLIISKVRFWENIRNFHPERP